MTVAVRVTATITGHRRRGAAEHELTLDLAPGEVSARQLIEAAVAAEVTAFQARAEAQTFVRVLSKDGLREDLERGAVRLGDPEFRAPDVNLAAAADAALLAFGDGIFKVFVGEDEVESGAKVRLEDGASVLFLRLVPRSGPPDCRTLSGASPRRSSRPRRRTISSPATAPTSGSAIARSRRAGNSTRCRASSAPRS